jgi:sugar lactone lactonase YvrE
MWRGCLQEKAENVIKKNVARVSSMLAVAGLLAVPAVAMADDQPVDYRVTPYATGLSSPRGLTLDGDGNVVVAVQGTGQMDSGVIRLRDLDADGVSNATEWKHALSGLPSAAGPEGQLVGASDIAFDANGEMYVVTGIFEADRDIPTYQAVWSTLAERYAVNEFTIASPYASLWDHEVATNPDGAQLDSNPYSLVVDGDGNAYVNDSGANATLKVAPDGTVSTYAWYPMFPVSPELEMGDAIDAVPTGIAWGPDGALYVSFLHGEIDIATGLPPFEQSGVVYRLADDNGDGDAMDDGEMSEYASGLTTSTAIAFDNEGRLLSTEFRGFYFGEQMNNGRVVRWNAETESWDVLADGLTTPTGLTVAADGTVYVAEEFINQVTAITTAAEPAE